MDAQSYFDSQANFNKWLKQLTEDEQRMIVDMLNEFRQQNLQQADVSGNAALIAQNKKLNKELEIVHDCLTDLYNDRENRIGNRVRKCLDKIEKHCR